MVTRALNIAYVDPTSSFELKLSIKEIVDRKEILVYSETGVSVRKGR